ncbi:predicted iron-sulfur flavoprotein [Candidatus Vecturithrix granuli]|uniref:Predicted iron-sulfur flavoprotein n=1 Tax=Vecturithrix granuli TaxID=1499967 RepID=A0A081BXD9_VECG1|nr:predicted iron-sulfur flavoprotein [Candidatus Vecturithrix granuli]
MKITVLNGSPKGDQSVTMQYVHFLQKKFPQHELKIVNITHRINKFEKDEQAFQEVITEVASSDGVLWAFPLYVMLVAAGYKRFIELIWERKAQEAFKDKYAAIIATSIHFYDHTALNYIHGICDDLNMKYVDAFSAEMLDLTREPQRQKFLLFAENYFDAIEHARPTFKAYPPVNAQSFTYTPGSSETRIDAGNKKVIIVADIEDEQSNLAKMVARVQQAFSGKAEIHNLRQLDMKGGCLGCIRCGYDNTCVWEGKDEYIDFYRNTVQTADILIFAGNIHDRYLSSRWKMFFDRSFFNGHVPTLGGKQIGWILSGPLSQLANLRQILEAYTELQPANLVDIVSDECADSSQIDARLEALAANLVRLTEKQYVMPTTYLGVGGAKIFRDGIWGRMRIVFQADYKYYKAHGAFDDFPQKDYVGRLLALVVPPLLKIPAFRKRVYTQEMIPGMLRPYKKVLEQVS